MIFGFFMRLRSKYTDNKHNANNFLSLCKLATIYASHTTPLYFNDASGPREGIRHPRLRTTFGKRGKSAASFPKVEAARQTRPSGGMASRLLHNQNSVPTISIPQLKWAT
jgi:hypothetical protein